MFDQFQTDKVKIIKKVSGAISPEIKALVDSKGGVVHIHTQHLPEGWVIEDGDHIDRVLPNDRSDRYLVIDNGYKARWQVFPERYECKVRKLSAPELSQQSSVIYNLSGNNVRVYNASIDNSTNTISLPNAELFAALSSTIKEHFSNNDELIEIVKEMQSRQGKPEFLKSYQNFIASTANHITILAPFLPALTQMIR